MKKQKRIPGIMGGMGPGATRDLYGWVIQLTDAKTDQEHLEILIHGYPHLDRTAAIVENKPSPLPTLVKSAQLLEKAGAEYLAIPCNTAHYFLPEIQTKIKIPLLNMIQETGLFLKKNKIKKAGLLSTSGTAKSGIYQKYIKNLIIPSQKGIKDEMEAIYGKSGIKAGPHFEKSRRNKNLLLSVISELQEKGAKAIIMGCTEIPLCLEQQDTKLLLINPTEILARAIVREAYIDY